MHIPNRGGGAASPGVKVEGVILMVNKVRGKQVYAGNLHFELPCSMCMVGYVAWVLRGRVVGAGFRVMYTVWVSTIV